MFLTRLQMPQRYKLQFWYLFIPKYLPQKFEYNTYFNRFLMLNRVLRTTELRTLINATKFRNMHGTMHWTYEIVLLLISQCRDFKMLPLNELFTHNHCPISHPASVTKANSPVLNLFSHIIMVKQSVCIFKRKEESTQMSIFDFFSKV